VNVFAMMTTSATRGHTAVALKSFFSHTAPEQIGAFIVLDCSGDFVVPPGTPADRLKVVGRTKGRPAGVATAFAAARDLHADLFLLDNNVVFTSGWFEPLLVDRPGLVSAVSNVDVSYESEHAWLRPTMSIDDLRGHEVELAALVSEHHRTHADYQRSSAPAFFCIKIPVAVREAVGEPDTRFRSGSTQDADYALRACLAGFPCELATASYVLRLNDVSSAREASARAADKGAAETNVFKAKWGSALTYAYVGRDWNLFLSESRLAAAIEHRDYKPVVEFLLANPSLDSFIERQQHARFGAVCLVYEDDSWLPLTIEPIYNLCDSIWFLVSDRPWYGEPTDQSPMLDRIQALPDPEGKFRIVAGSWRDECHQRNEAMRRLREADIDYCFVLDADEIWDPEVLGQAMDLARQHPQIGIWRAGCYTYWKSFRYRVDPPEPYRSIVFMRVGAGRFFHGREGVADTQVTLPIESVAFHHMSYARSDELIRRKIDTFTHKLDVVPGWYENVWLGWDANRSMEDVHPCWPAAYKRIVEQPRAAMPPALRRLHDAEAHELGEKTTVIESPAG
jgi:hypothetical protein